MIEISRRCSSCGASVRDADALFCAECGKPLSKDVQDASAVADQATPAPATTEVATNDAAAPVQSANADNSNIIEEPPSEPSPAAVDSPSPPPTDRAPVETHPHRIGRTRETLHRASAVASAAARGVIEEPAKRVERIRHASTHVIEEASYDPSLRFVLVALALFVVFIILLVVSKVMG